ncbi:MAG TPA: hypothetical protein VF741_04475 [Candidatus Aquilonibacter sp.]
MLHALFAAIVNADVLISAGHEGRPASCAYFPQHKCNLGAAGERAWTPIVADEATRMLRAHGLNVAREPADFDGTYDVGMAIFIHFDGIVPACKSGASIGYYDDAVSRAAAQQWRALYEPLFPFTFMPDNFTAGLRRYYGYRQVDARDGALVFELGEITCPAQRAWLAPRLEALGDLIAYYVSRAIGKGDVPLPAKFASTQ